MKYGDSINILKSKLSLGSSFGSNYFLYGFNISSSFLILSYLDSLFFKFLKLYFLLKKVTRMPLLLQADELDLGYGILYLLENLVYSISVNFSFNLS
jgi:hypothetical protein